MCWESGGANVCTMAALCEGACVYDSTHLQSAPDYNFNLAQSHWGICQVAEREEKEEELPALYLDKLSLWTPQQERGKLKNDF